MPHTIRIFEGNIPIKNIRKVVRNEKTITVDTKAREYVFKAQTSIQWGSVSPEEQARIWEETIQYAMKLEKFQRDRAHSAAAATSMKTVGKVTAKRKTKLPGGGGPPPPPPGGDSGGGAPPPPPPGPSAGSAPPSGGGPPPPPPSAGGGGAPPPPAPAAEEESPDFSSKKLSRRSSAALPEPDEDDEDLEWIDAVDDATGKTYFHNAKTGETRWDNPRGRTNSVADGATWIEAQDAATGRSYYFHARTGETRWFKPAEIGDEVCSIACQ
jgi:hypothetical protein